VNIRRIILFSAFFSVFVCCFISSNLVLKKNRNTLGANYSMTVSPFPPEALAMLSGEFKSLMADYLLLEIGAFVGSNKEISSYRWEKVCLGFAQAMHLDPYFEQTYLMLQAILPWDANKPEKAIELLEISGKHRPWDWRPGYYMGFDYYYFLKDYEKASEVFLNTAKIPGAPVLITLLGARFAQKSERKATAVHLLSTMLEDPNLDENSQKEIKNRIVALKGVLVLEKAIETFTAQFNRKPDTLDELTTEGILEALPINPYLKGYQYKDGQVEF
jgi:tetratricopeptide (TPR) repeat protein